MQIITANDYVESTTKLDKPNDALQGSLVEALRAEPAETVKLLVGICEKAMQSRAQAWERYSRKYRRGLRYVSQEGSKNPLYSTNYMFNVVETLKANLTNALPALTMQPVEDGDVLAADIFTKVLRQSLKRAELHAHTERVVQHGAITGTGWYKIWFDPDAFHGKGDLAIESIAPEDLLVLPTSLDYRTSPLFIHRLRDVPESQIRAQYDVDKVLGAPESTLINNDRSLGDVDRDTHEIKSFNVYEAWVKDYETGEWYICTIAGNTVLRKPELSPYIHERAPFVPWYDAVDVRADQAYTIGIGEVEEIEMLQDMSDALDMRIYKNIKQITGRQRVLNPASGINREDIDDSPNRVYLCTGRPQDAIMWDNPPALSQDVYVYREKIEDRIQVVSGIFDVTQGKKPAGIQAARAVSALQSAAAKRIEKKTEALVKTIEDVGTLAAQIILQYYTDERIIRVAGSQNIKLIGDYPESLALPEDADDLEQEEIDMVNTQKQMWREQNGIDLVLADVRFNYDIVASTDTGLPADKGDRMQLATDLFRLGALDRKALLDAVDYPDREQILKRLEGTVTGKTPAEATPENQALIQQAMPQQGAPQQGMPQQGAPQQGMPQQGGGGMEQLMQQLMGGQV